MTKPDQKTAMLRVRLTPTELRDIEYAAIEADKTTSKWVRDTLFAAISEPDSTQSSSQSSHRQPA